MNVQLIVILLMLNNLPIKPIMNMLRLLQLLKNIVFKIMLVLSQLCLNPFLSFRGTFFCHRYYFQEFVGSYVHQAKLDSLIIDFISQMREGAP